MKTILSDEGKKRLEGRIADIEKRCDAQVVLAVIQRCDVYAELPWKAFALGASLAGLLAVVWGGFGPWTRAEWAILTAVVVTLGAGAVFALLGVFVPPLGRLFLDARRAEVETRQYAESLFLNRGLFTTQKRKGLLLLAGLFERQVVLLPDIGLAPCLTQDRMQDVIASMKTDLAAGRIAPAFEKGLAKLEEILAAGLAEGDAINELSDHVIEEKGA